MKSEKINLKSAILYAAKSTKEGSEKGEHAKQIAQALAAGTQLFSYAIGKNTFVSDTNVLFLGCAVNASGKTPGAVRKLMKGIKGDQVRLVVVFSASKGGTVSALNEIKSVLEPAGVNVSSEEFFCNFTKNGVSGEDLQKARDFAQGIMAKNRL
jgi:hypothetical protein